ncbi:putative class I-like SAM-dependent O-methyltransferase [Helianthus annuus]|nr:putative class I-like SAM-dependent O-methyltransferase [Helianthus annuus]
MGTAPDAGQMIGLLLKIVGAKKTIEVGVFTGYSWLLTALTIPDDGKGCHGHCTRRRPDNRAFVKDRWREKNNRSL